MQVVSSFLPFPPISWFATTANADIVVLDAAEHFEKMSYRNKYTIGGANNVNQLSIPLVSGRNQRIPMAEVVICNTQRWQVQHWRTLMSVYKRSPYWDHYEAELQTLFETPFHRLVDFNLASLEWLKKQMKLPFDIVPTNAYVAEYAAGTADIRPLKPSQERKRAHFPRYYQVFEDRIGFIPNLSILDLLFSEGPHTAGWLRENANIING